MLYFSPSAVGFYDDDLHSTLPGDAVQISAALHAQLVRAQLQGMLITADDQGRPIAAEQPLPSTEQQMAALRQRRDSLLAASDHTQMADAPLPEEQRAAWREYRQALRELPAAVTDLSAIQWPVAPSN